MKEKNLLNLDTMGLNILHDALGLYIDDCRSMYHKTCTTFSYSILSDEEKMEFDECYHNHIDLALTLRSIFEDALTSELEENFKDEEKEC